MTNLQPSQAANDYKEIPAAEPSALDLGVGEHALSVVSGTGGASKDGKETTLSVDGVKIDTQKARENVEHALGILCQHFTVDKNRIKLKTLSGNAVATTDASGISIDPIIIAHPGLVHALLHEGAHKGGKVGDEALVEGYARAIGYGEHNNLPVTKEYEDALSHFYELVGKILRGENRQSVSPESDEFKGKVVEIYGLYEAEQYEGIYELYEREYMRKLETEEEQDEGHKFFFTVFTELKPEADGHCHMKEAQNEGDGEGGPGEVMMEDEPGDAEKDEGKEVVSLASRKVASTEIPGGDEKERLAA